MKTCSSCGEEKEFTSFLKDKRYKDGYIGQCRICRNKKQHEYYLDNKENTKKTKAIWRSKNKERIAGYQRKYRAEDPDKFLDRHRRWASNNKEAVNELSHRRRARVASNGVYKILPKHLSKLYNSPCTYCGSVENITADHVVPVSRGGVHSIGNLVPACGSCNSSKKDKLLTEWRKP